MIKNKCMIIILVGLFSGLAHAQSGSISTTDLSEDFFRTGVALSMGGAYRGLANTTQATLYNPSGMKQHQGSLLAAGDYAYIRSYDGHLYGVSIIDTQTSDVAYGVSYHQSSPVVGGVSAKNNQVILSMAHEAGILLLGASAKGYWVNIDNPNIEGPKGIDLDVSVMVKASEAFSLSVVGYNVLRGQNIEEYPFKIGAGTALTLFPQATFTFDLTKNFNTPSDDNVNAHFGGSFDVNEQFVLRGGYAIDRVRGNDYYGVGLGVSAQKAKVNFAFSQTLDPQTETYSVSVEYQM